ncbi:hypothetical protein NECAME_05714 [Necator americanus]|uniref:C2HC/C3H-type domain-containing protein n=1 Tax=Necator americanus TaxID=51031 RepID=W2SFC9_NECAM|nr:hypothetical protein NECAME_05714 [Necator americanus]ETN68233.1 hypothetical protein NECAME_05714 [Necator americanus]
MCKKHCNTGRKSQVLTLILLLYYFFGIQLGGIYPRPLTNWKDRHETFIDAVSSSKKVDYAIKTGAPLPPPPRTAVPSDYVQCNYCGRNFSEKAAERHIPFCREQSTKKLTKSPAWPSTTKGKTVVKNEGASEILSETSQRRRMQSSSSFTWHNDDYTLRKRSNSVSRNPVSRQKTSTLMTSCMNAKSKRKDEGDTM